MTNWQPIETTELERLAKAAMPGPWVAEGIRPNMIVVFSGETPGSGRLSPCMLMDDNQEANAAYIAAANPETILHLIAMLNAAERKTG